MPSDNEMSWAQVLKRELCSKDFSGEGPNGLDNGKEKSGKSKNKGKKLEARSIFYRSFATYVIERET